MDYEGIYRKTGGHSGTKAVEQLFERGNYDSFNLEDTEVFNDVACITSTLKSYFRMLPNPLLTSTLHESFIAGIRMTEPDKTAVLREVLRQLPREHYATLRFLMLHLHRVTNCKDENKMTASNLGVVFGRESLIFLLVGIALNDIIPATLMRSNDPSMEFGNMGEKSQTVQWLIEQAPVIFVD